MESDISGIAKAVDAIFCERTGSTTSTGWTQAWVVFLLFAMLEFWVRVIVSKDESSEVRGNWRI